jgi:hypothetical protein
MATSEQPNRHAWQRRSSAWFDYCRSLGAIAATGLLVACNDSDGQKVFETIDRGAAQSLCKDLEKIIDESILTIALSEAEGQLFDKSAPQQTARFLGFNNQLQVININLAIQSQNKCPSRKGGVNPFRYKLQALECLTARLKKDESSALKCDVRAWRLE